MIGPEVIARIRAMPTQSLTAIRREKPDDPIVAVMESVLARRTESEQPGRNGGPPTPALTLHAAGTDALKDILAATAPQVVTRHARRGRGELRKLIETPLQTPAEEETTRAELKRQAELIQGGALPHPTLSPPLTPLPIALADTLELPPAPDAEGID